MVSPKNFIYLEKNCSGHIFTRQVILIKSVVFFDRSIDRERELSFGEIGEIE